MTTTSDGLREQARHSIANQPFKTVTVLSSLLSVQDELGYLPEEAIEEVALLTGASINSVWGVASFYPNFRFTPPARHSVEVCWGPTCHLLGAQPLLQGLLDKLGLEQEGDTADGEITLKFNTCLGVCAHGPAMSFDHHLAGRMSLEKAVRRLEALRANGASGHGAAHAKPEAKPEPQAKPEPEVTPESITSEPEAKPQPENEPKGQRRRSGGRSRGRGKEAKKNE